LRRCHARDLFEQIQNYCEYNELDPTVNEQHLDYAVRNYFTALPEEQREEDVDRATAMQANPSSIERNQTLIRAR
jgi:hypothetical protein